MRDYIQKKDYKVSQKNINTILAKLEMTPHKTVHYVGYADKDLILALKEKYEVSISDYFDRTNTSIGFWYEGEEEEGFPLPPLYQTGWKVFLHQ